MSKNTKSENNITSFLDRKYQNELCNSPCIKPIVELMYPYIMYPYIYDIYNHYEYVTNVYHSLCEYIELTHKRKIYGISGVTISSATLSKITDITNKYLSDKRIYIPEIIPHSYHYLSRGNNKSLKELCYFIKLISNSERSQFPYDPYLPEYTVQNYKSDMENLYKAMISQKILNSYSTQNNSPKQRSNNQEEMSCLKLIADRNNTTNKFHK